MRDHYSAKQTSSSTGRRQTEKSEEKGWQGKEVLLLEIEEIFEEMKV
jgi:hypothetical protein